MTEQWRPVLGWAGMYEVSSLGRVKSLARYSSSRRFGKIVQVTIHERIMKPRPTLGYNAVSLRGDGRHRRAYIHELVCEAWHGPRPHKHDVAHSDGNRTNNTPSNLRWATRRENIRDKVLHGTQPRGDDLWFTKIPDATVVAIRSDRSKTAYRWAKELEVSPSTVSAIRRGEERRYAGAV